jgi:hypothetical protein
MELPFPRQESHGSQAFVEAIRRISGVSEQQHRPDALTEKPIRNLADQQSAKPVPVKAPQDIDLVEFALVAKDAAVMSRAPCETNELMRVLFDDKREVHGIIRAENPLPLSFTN